MTTHDKTWQTTTTTTTNIAHEIQLMTTHDNHDNNKHDTRWQQRQQSQNKDNNVKSLHNHNTTWQTPTKLTNIAIKHKQWQHMTTMTQSWQTISNITKCKNTNHDNLKQINGNNMTHNDRHDTLLENEVQTMTTHDTHQQTWQTITTIKEIAKQ